MDKGPVDPTELTASASDTAVELGTRLVFSLLKAAVHIAARFEMPLGRLTDLLRTAYFGAYRDQHPRDLATVAKRLGVSIRTAGTLNRSLREPFFTPENEVAPIRRVTGALLSGAHTVDEIEAHTDLEIDEIERVLAWIAHLGWTVPHDDGSVDIVPHLRSFVDADPARRVDGLNHQMEILASSVWFRFVRNEAHAGARSWAFVASPEQFAAAMERSIQALRAEAVEMEQAALEQGVEHRFGITVAFSPLEDRK